MNTPIVPEKMLNEEIFAAIEQSCFLVVERMEQSEEFFNKRDALLEQIKGKVPRDVHNDLSDLYMNLASHYAHEMFQLGIMVGRNPEIIFELPDVG
jgi:hypothetical protein